jgi:hypothetical protein
MGIPLLTFPQVNQIQSYLEAHPLIYPPDYLKSKHVTERVAEAFAKRQVYPDVIKTGVVNVISEMKDLDEWIKIYILDRFPFILKECAEGKDIKEPHEYPIGILDSEKSNEIP